MSIPAKATGLRAAAVALACMLAFAASLVFAQPAQAEEYGLSIGPTKVTSDNAADVLGDGTVSYDPETSTLTLNNATLKHGRPDNSFCTAILTWVDLTIKLEGDNVILPESDTGSTPYLFGICSHGSKLTFEGPGSLTIDGAFFPDGIKQYVGILSPSADIAFTKGATVSIDFTKWEGDGSYGVYGIYASGSDHKITVDNATLHIGSLSIRSSAYCIQGNTLEVVNNGRLNAMQHQSDVASSPISLSDNLVISNGAVMTVGSYGATTMTAVEVGKNVSLIDDGFLQISSAYGNGLTVGGTFTMDDDSLFTSSANNGLATTVLPTGLSEGAKAFVLPTSGSTALVKMAVKDIDFPTHYISIPAKALASRIAGDYANETAARLADILVAGECPTVVLARDDDFADALGATGLAGALRVPILLTDRTTLSPAAAESINKMGAIKVYIIGGTGAMKEQLEVDLAEQCGITDVVRVWGESSYDTSLECAKAIEEITGEPATTAIIAMSTNFQDALSMSGIAFMGHMPVILQTWGDTSADRGFTDEAKAYLADKQLIVAGGPGAISDESLAGLDVIDRIYGETGYDTSAAIAKWGLEKHYFRTDAVIIACGAQAPKGTDALAGSALSGTVGAPILLVNANEEMEPVNTVATDTMLGDGNPYEMARIVIVLGGNYVIPQEFLDTLEIKEVPSLF